MPSVPSVRPRELSEWPCVAKAHCVVKTGLAFQNILVCACEASARTHIRRWPKLGYTVGI